MSATRSSSSSTSRCTRLDLSSRAASRHVTACGLASTASMPGLRLITAMMHETHCTCTSSSSARWVARVCECESTSRSACAPSRARKEANLARVRARVRVGVRVGVRARVYP